MPLISLKPEHHLLFRFSVPPSVNLPCLWVLGISLFRIVHPQEWLLIGLSAAVLSASLLALPPGGLGTRVSLGLTGMVQETL